MRKQLYLTFSHYQTDNFPAVLIAIPADTLKTAIDIASRPHQDLHSTLQSLRQNAEALFYSAYGNFSVSNLRWISQALSKTFSLHSRRLRRTQEPTRFVSAHIGTSSYLNDYSSMVVGGVFRGVLPVKETHPLTSLAKKLAEEIQLHQSNNAQLKALLKWFRDPWNNYPTLFHLTHHYDTCQCPVCSAHKAEDWSYPSAPIPPSTAPLYMLPIVTAKAQQPIDNPDVPQAAQVMLGALLPAGDYLNARLQQIVRTNQEWRDPENLLRILRNHNATLFLQVHARKVTAEEWQRFLHRAHGHLTALHSTGKVHNPYALPIIFTNEETLHVPHHSHDFTLHTPVYVEDAPLVEALQSVAEWILRLYQDRQSPRLSTLKKLFTDPITPSIIHAIHWTPNHRHCICGLCQSQHPNTHYHQGSWPQNPSPALVFPTHTYNIAPQRARQQQSVAQ